MSRAYTLFHQATVGFRPPAKLDTSPATTGACASCRRDWAAVEDRGQAMAYQYSAGYAVESVCTTCYTPRMGAADMLGIERQTGSGTPVEAKLGMLPGAGGVITPAGDLYLSMPQGWIDKFQDGELCQSGRLHGGSALSLLLTLHQAGELDNAHLGFVYVENWGRKADVLMASWRASFSLDEVWCVSERGAVPLELGALIQTARVLHEQGLGAKAMTPGFWRPIVRLAEGHCDNRALLAWTEKLPDASAVMAVLPVDPHSRQRLTSVMRELIPLIEGGLL